MPMRDLPVVPGSSEYPPSRARAKSLRGWDTRLVGTERATVVLRGGWQALAEADWERARVCFEQASELDESPEALDGLSQALHFQGEYDRAIGLKERAFAEYRRRGQWAEAADLARWLAFLQVCVHGNLAVGSGWMARAARLLDGAEECAAHGWLTLDRAPFSRDSAEREQLAKAAIAIAKRFDDTDLEFDALALLGEAYVASGRVAEGMALLDEAMAAVLAGEVVSHGSVGMICCRLLSACRADDGCEARRAVDGGGGSSRGLEQLRVADLPVPLRRDPDRDRAVAGGGGGAARRDPRVRDRLPGRASLSLGPAGRPTREAGAVRGSRAPAGRGRMASHRETVAGQHRVRAGRPRAGRRTCGAVPRA